MPDVPLTDMGDGPTTAVVESGIIHRVCPEVWLEMAVVYD
jgi:hypothetical protein